MERIPYGYRRGSLSSSTDDARILRSRLFVTLFELNIIRRVSPFQQLTWQHEMPSGPLSNASISLIFPVVTLDRSKVTLAICLQL